MEHDILSDVLRGIRLRGAAFYDYRFGPEWAAEAPPTAQIAPLLLPGVEHVMAYHVLLRGAGFAAVAGQQPIRLSKGDAILLPHGDGHWMSSRLGLRPRPFDLAWAYAHRDDPRPVPFNALGNDDPSLEQSLSDAENRVICGFLCCDLLPFNPLLGQLPPLLHVPAGADSNWIAQTLEQALQAGDERRPGNEAILERISEMLFVHAVRGYLAHLDHSATGWLSGLRDRRIGHALALLHAESAHDWSVEELGRLVGLSRSALHDRFVELIGQPPMQYLLRWRMQLASTLLRSTSNTVASIALEVGYGSEAAFTRAFKRAVGVAPSAWRRGPRAKD